MKGSCTLLCLSSDNSLKIMLPKLKINTETDKVTIHRALHHTPLVHWCGCLATKQWPSACDSQQPPWWWTLVAFCKKTIANPFPGVMGLTSPSPSAGQWQVANLAMMMDDSGSNRHGEGNWCDGHGRQICLSMTRPLLLVLRLHIPCLGPLVELWMVRCGDSRVCPFSTFCSNHF